ncbi:phosphotransferase [Akkermansiaceae bacterium]|nr:phosphotransferase [Akkermansiaceae bacterium]
MELQQIAARFILPGPVVAHEEITTGLINTTYAITCRSGKKDVRFILQSINSAVFPEPERVMENIFHVTLHIGSRDPGTEQIQLIPIHEGRSWLRLPNNTIWRCYPYHEETESYDKIDSPELAFRAAAAFGRFQSRLSDLDPSTLHETIPNFHHTPTYFAKLLAAVKSDPVGRLAGAQAEVDFILSKESLTTALTGAGLPVRITHNDTKISNILFPTDPALPPIVIDLDTVMPGLSLFDYGDMVRSAASSAAEDEPDLEKVFIINQLRDALTEGYLSTAGDFLTPREKALLPLSPKVITLELATRFLTDHLLGDKYFRVKFPDHNLVRARNQLALLKSM